MHKQFTNIEQSEYEYAKAPESMGVYLSEVDIFGKTIVDFGCGWGGETKWLSEQGAAKVIGIDVNEDALTQSRNYCGTEAEFTSDITKVDDCSCDAVFSTNVFEHVLNMEETLDQLWRILRPGGCIVSNFGPLFYSPYGCHFYWAGLYPWSHLWLGRGWLQRKADRLRGVESDAKSWAEMGLNKITFQSFAKIARKRFQIRRLRAVPVMGLPFVTQIPVIRKYMTFGCDMHLLK